MDMPRSIEKSLEALDLVMVMLADQVIVSKDLPTATELTMTCLMPMIEFRRQHVEAMDFLNYRASEDDSLDAEPMSMGKPGSGGVAEMETAIHQVYLDEVKVPIPWSDEG